MFLLPTTTPEYLHDNISAPLLFKSRLLNINLERSQIQLSSYCQFIDQEKEKKMPLIAQNPVPRAILGLMTFGPEGTESKGTRLSSLDKCLDYFQQQGFNEVDTARLYVAGEQEAFTAQAKWKERGLTLATKWYPKTPGDHKANVLRENVGISLKELQTDQVDIFYLHAPDRSVPFTETLEEVNKLHKEGKFVQLGLSNYTAFEVAEIVTICNERGWVRPTIYQAMYNAISKFGPTLELNLGQSDPCMH